MSVELDPHELGFRRPFTQEVSQVLRLHNPSSDPVAFKVKTTAPKQYCVRPNSGRIEGGRDVEVQVLLQAMKEDPPPDARCRDKFLVQSVAIPADTSFNTVSQIWANIESTAKSSIQEKKIRVNFLPAGGDNNTSSTGGASGAVGGATTNGVSHPQDDEPPSYSSPSPAAVTPQRQSTAAPSGAISTPSEKPSDAKSRGDAVNSASNPATDSTLGATAAAVTNAIPTSSDDMKRQLAAANAQIQQLQQQMSEGLRQRAARTGAQESGSGAGEKSEAGAGSMGLQNAPAPGGVPVQYVAALCLLCFLIAYLLF